MAHDAGTIGDLFDIQQKHRRARKRDPETSHQSAAMADALAERHRALILSSPGGTIHEIAAVAGIDHVAVARRMKELQVDGLVELTSEKRASPNGRPCRVWKISRSA